MPYLDYYKHLNEIDPPRMPLTMEQLVEVVLKMNYGAHRFLSEMVRQRRASPDYKEYASYREQTTMLEELIEKGFF